MPSLCTHISDSLPEFVIDEQRQIFGWFLVFVEEILEVVLNFVLEESIVIECIDEEVLELVFQIQKSLQSQLHIRLKRDCFWLYLSISFEEYTILVSDSNEFIHLCIYMRIPWQKFSRIQKYDSIKLTVLPECTERDSCRFPLWWFPLPAVSST